MYQEVGSLELSLADRIMLVQNGIKFVVQVREGLVWSDGVRNTKFERNSVVFTDALERYQLGANDGFSNDKFTTNCNVVRSQSMVYLGGT